MQIDDEIREMTDEEYKNYLQVITDATPLPNHDTFSV